MSQYMASTAIPGIGRYVSFTDPEGNRVSMLQPIARAGQPKTA